MTEVIPFRGIYYNRDQVAACDVVAPPYDVISPEMKEALYEKSPRNIVQIDAGKDLPGDTDVENKYSRSKRLFEQWLADGTLVRSEKPTFYAYRMTFTSAGKQHSLTGLYGLVRLVELGQGVYPHEATHSGPKKDRLTLMNETGANTSPIYSLYRSGRQAEIDAALSRATSAAPYMSAPDPDGTEHSFWIINNDADNALIQAALKDAPIYIADGHHRYETALEYQRRMREEEGNPAGDRPYDYVLMFLAAIDDPALVVLPTHRVATLDVESMAERLEEGFWLEELPEGTDIIKAITGRTHTFGLYDGERSYLLQCMNCTFGDLDPALARLDVTVLHKIIFGSRLDLGGWGYEMNPDLARTMVDAGDYDVAFFLNPTAVKDVEEVASKGLRMPPKSTYFYPKVQTGFIINSLKTL